MRWLVFWALAIRYLVLFMLLMGTNQLCGAGICVARLLVGAVVGVLYGTLCMEQELFFLGNRFWYFVFTILIGLCSFGMTRNSVRPIMIFLLINLIIDGVATDKTDILSGILSLVGLGVLYVVGFWQCGGQLIPVEITLHGRKQRLTAFRDTGHQLRDPLTGKPVLIVGPDVALKLAGLTSCQLKDPVKSLVLSKGLRLIPYNTIGQAGSLMLAMEVDELRLGRKKYNAIVAFAPENIGENGCYQALAGGYL